MATLPSLRALTLAALTLPALAQNAGPGARVLLDAHNCYPYQGRSADRIDRALQTGLPVAVEQDLIWRVDPATGKARSIVSHGSPYTGQEPGMKEYFFERIRPLMEEALRKNDRAQWPLITLNLDFKTEPPEHLKAVWELLGEYEGWLTTAPRTTDPSQPAPLTWGPLLVLTGQSDVQQAVFHDALPVGTKLRLFGAVRPAAAPSDLPMEERVRRASTAAPSALWPERAGNYRRWMNLPWLYVEAGGPPQAGAWTKDDAARLEALVKHAHAQGVWIRLYTLNGNPGPEAGETGAGYKFGTPEAVRERWQAAIRAGVDYVATDEYEAFGKLLK